MNKAVAIALVLVLLLVLAAGGAFRYAVRSLEEPSSLNTAVVYRVPAHARFSQVAAELYARGALARPRILTLYARLTGKASQIKAGEYEIMPGTSPRRLLQQLIDGAVLLHPFTIIEGWQVRDLLDALRKDPDIRQTPGLSAGGIMARLGEPGLNFEGQFLPETYMIPSGTTDLAMLTMAHAALARTLQSAWTTRAPILPLRDAQQLLTLASIVEKETGLAQERAKIAGVYVQRLLVGMRLQADPTVIYGLGERYDGSIHAQDLKTDGPYNTYTRSGLPPTPIALPGAAAIRTSAQPEMTGALYFVASGAADSGHVFSTNLDDHNRAVARYLRRLREANEKPAGVR